MSYRLFKYVSRTTGETFVGLTTYAYQSQVTGHEGKKFRGRFAERIKELGWDDFKYRVLEEGIEGHDNAYSILERYANELNATQITSLTRDEYVRKRMRESAISTRRGMKRVAKCDERWNVLEVYSSICEAARQNNCAQSNISGVLAGKHERCAGFRWKLLDATNLE